MTPDQEPTLARPHPDLLRRRIARRAAIALGVFTLATIGALAVWFSRAAQPWGWRSTLSILCVVFGGVSAVAVWRSPSRRTAAAGIGVILLSLARVGPPDEWTWWGIIPLLFTAVLVAPLVHALFVLPWRAA